MSGDICTDNRFELIDKYQKILIDRTNITDSPDDMKALYSILYRFWQMGWLDRLDAIADLEDENAKLRELVCDVVLLAGVNGCDVTKMQLHAHDGDWRTVWERMRELGAVE